jgi:hypothetical protein
MFVFQSEGGALYDRGRQTCHVERRLFSCSRTLPSKCFNPESKSRDLAKPKFGAFDLDRGVGNELFSPPTARRFATNYFAELEGVH